MDLNDTYIEIDFDVSPPAGRDILLALLSSHQFESFLETDTGLKAYVRQNNWKSINLEQLTNNMPSNFVVSHRIAGATPWHAAMLFHRRHGRCI